MITPFWLKSRATNRCRHRPPGGNRSSRPTGQGIVAQVSNATRRSYDRVAVRYAAEIGDELAGKPLDRALLNAFAEQVSGPVLDVGGGPGHVADYLAQRGASVVSTDLSPAMCELARQAGLPSVVADMTALPVRVGRRRRDRLFVRGDPSRHGGAVGGLRVVLTGAAAGWPRVNRVPHP